MNVVLYSQYATITCTLSAKMVHCPTVVRHLPLLLVGTWKKFGQPITGERETCLQELNVCSAANRAGVLSA